MAFTKITGYGISETTNVHVGIITATSGLKGIGIFSGGSLFMWRKFFGKKARINTIH